MSFQAYPAGAVYNKSSRSIQPLVGFPGSSYLGLPLLSDVDAASIAPDGSKAWVSKEGRSGFWTGLLAGAATDTAVVGLIDGVERVAWNSNGSAALLYAASGKQLQVIRFNGQKAAVGEPIDGGFLGQGRVTALAVDTTGQRIAVGISHRQGGALYSWTAEEGPSLLASMEPVAATFDEEGTRLYAIDGGSLKILEFDNLSGPLEFALLASSDGAKVDPAGIAVSRKGRYLIMVDRANPSVRVYATADGSLANTFSLDFAPSRLERLSADGVFLLNRPGPDEWMLVLDARETPCVYFVPASPKDPK